jgi:hypothetical protein
MALLDSTYPKVSNDILFVIFGRRNQKIWISKDLDEIWFQTSIWIEFKPRTDTCRVLTGRYQFGWILD